MSFFDRRGKGKQQAGAENVIVPAVPDTQKTAEMSGDSFTDKTTGGSADHPDTIMVAVPFSIHSLPGGDILVLNKEQGKTIYLDPLEASVLQALKHPQDSRSLSQTLRSSGWEEEGLAEVPGILENLSDLGLVVSTESLIGASSVSDDADRRLPVNELSFLAWPTAGRSEMIDRALTSWEELLTGAKSVAEGAAEGTEPLPGLIIADDSGDDRARAVVERHNASWPGEIHYLGDEFRRELALKLEKACGPIVRFALGIDVEPGLTQNPNPGSYGANRNLILQIGRASCRERV